MGISLLAFVVLIVFANRVDYKPLFASLGADDAGVIVKRLKEQKVPYRLASDGTAILVPADKVYELRLSLASEGLPQGGGVGFEIFDRKNFGVTEFVQKINYQRALQGELARTISQLGGVGEARVHLALPEKSLFTDDQKPATASVVVRMKAGGYLRDSEVQGIVHLVAASVEGMDPGQVSVLDSRGKILSRSGPEDADGKMTASMLDTQHAYEKNLEERIQSLLDRVVGPGKSVARVTAQLDFKKVEKVEESYDPKNSAVRSEQLSSENGGATTIASGVPGVQTNLGKGAVAPVNGAGASKSDATRNYEVNHASTHTVVPVGALAKLSVAILVDGKYVAAAGKTGATGSARYAPLAADEMQKIETLVKSAVGFDPTRGDQVSVENLRFQDGFGVGGEDAVKWWENPVVREQGQLVLLGLAFLVFLLLIVRPLVRTIALPAENVKIGSLPLDAADEKTQIGVDLQAHISQLALKSATHHDLVESVKSDPYKVAQILQNWLKQTGEDGSRKDTP